MPPLTATIVPALKAADYRHRRAALVTLSMIAEGYADRMRENLATLIPLVLPLVKVRHKPDALLLCGTCHHLPRACSAHALPLSLAWQPGPQLDCARVLVLAPGPVGRAPSAGRL